MADTRYPEKRDTADLFSHPDQGLSEALRQNEIADRPQSVTGTDVLAVAGWDIGTSSTSLTLASSVWANRRIYLKFGSLLADSGGWTLDTWPSISTLSRLVPPSPGLYLVSLQVGALSVGGVNSSAKEVTWTPQVFSTNHFPSKQVTARTQGDTIGTTAQAAQDLTTPIWIPSGSGIAAVVDVDIWNDLGSGDPAAPTSASTPGGINGPMLSAIKLADLP